MIQKWYQNDQEGLKRGENFFCDVGCQAGLFLGCFWTLQMFGESAAEYAANFTDVLLKIFLETTEHSS